MTEFGDEMSRKEFSVAYNGSDRLRDHTIDVDMLAPALLAFGKLIREANREINGNTAKSKVLVVSDFEHKCFNINFEVLLTLLEQAKALFGTQDAKTAKEILEWIGLLKSTAGGAASTLAFLGFLKWRKGRKIEDVSEVKDSDQTGLVSVRIKGENNPVSIHNHTWNLANNPRMLAAARDSLAPVGTDGFETIELRDGEQVVGVIPKGDVDDILSSCLTGIEEAKDIMPDIEVTSAWLQVYSPVYEEKADMWRFKMGRDVVFVDISATSIAHDALERGGALVEDAYQVKMEVETPHTPEGKAKKPRYKILEVLRFIPANPAVQSRLKIEDPQDEGFLDDDS